MSNALPSFEGNALIESHIHLVRPIARGVLTHLPPSFELDDLIAEGYVGLIHAARRYDPESHNGTPFSAYARPRIRGAIVDSVRRKAWTENTAFPLEDAPEAVVGPKRPYLVRSPRAAREPGVTPLGRPIAIDPERMPKHLGSALRRLTGRQRAILGARYGEERPLAEIAEMMGLSSQQTAAECTRAIGALQKAAHSNVSIMGSTLVFLLPVPARRLGRVAA
jgi:RNA polymerase sigma factor (sigma-70 family)